MHELKNKSEIVYIRQACRIVSELLSYLSEITKPGVTTLWLDSRAEDFIKKKGGVPAFKNYNGFPSSICTSINEEVIHGIPSEQRIEEGDILSIDVGVKKAGYYGDAAVTLPAGQVEPELLRLLRVTEEALYAGIERAVVDNHVGDISRAVQETVERDGFSVVRDFVGHGVGKELHEEPPIPNYKTPGRGPRLVPGMTLAIEPMVNMGTYEVEIKEDNWTVVTKDGRPSAHFEHTILISEHGPEIFTMH
ncbi:MAG TPA: type I methionyl aminopeptidase [Spirochaetota bacterium]|nr:type I methionyl aminopeptidase [Spirochaetota bacterium]